MTNEEFIRMYLCKMKYDKVDFYYVVFIDENGNRKKVKLTKENLLKGIIYEPI